MRRRDLKLRRISSEVLVDNPWHRYCHDRYRLTDGTVGDYFYIEMTGSCGIVPLFEDGTTILLEVERYLLGARLWELPVGGMVPGDEPLAVARRELREEAGLEALTWTALGTVAPYKGASTERCMFYLAEGLSVVPSEPEPSESIRCDRVGFAEAGRRLLEQEIVDSQSLSGWLLAERHLTRRDEPRGGRWRGA